jgi:hypothetical protein
VDEFPPRIYPIRPDPFVYEPFHQTRAWVRQEAVRIAEEVRRSIEEQAEHLERQFMQHGAKQVGIRYLEPKKMRQMALRLYRAAVCHLSWGQIADLELDDNDPDAAPSDDNVRKSVSSWARALDIPLPPQKHQRR